MDGYIVGELYFLRCLEENVKMFMQVLKDFVLFLLELQVKYKNEWCVQYGVEIIEI